MGHGWIERVVFEDYFSCFFLKDSERWSNSAFPLIPNGHTSQISPSLALKAKQNNTVFRRLPSHLTHIFQPLDITVFGKVKRQWKTRLQWHSCSDQRQVSKRRFHKLKAMLVTDIKDENLKSGFKSTDIHPYCTDKGEHRGLYTGHHGRWPCRP